MGKSQFPSTFNWQTTSPITGFLPGPGPHQSVAGNSPLSGVVAGTMSGTNVIYTNILGLAQIDTQGLEITWTGTPTGTVEVWVSNSGINWAPLTFDPVLTQPTGSPLTIVVALQEIPFRYMFIKYTNASGSGTITAYSQCKAFNQ